VVEPLEAGALTLDCVYDLYSWSDISICPLVYLLSQKASTDSAGGIFEELKIAVEILRMFDSREPIH